MPLKDHIQNMRYWHKDRLARNDLRHQSSGPQSAIMLKVNAAETPSDGLLRQAAHRLTASRRQRAYHRAAYNA